MPQSTTSFHKRISETGQNLCLVILLIFVALGQTSVKLSETSDSVHSVIFIEILTLAAVFIAAAFLNRYLLVPHLLFRSKYIAYAGILVGLAILFIVIRLPFESVLLSNKRLSPDAFWIAPGNRVPFLSHLSNLAAYLISLVALSVIIFMRHWRQSDERLHKLEESSAYVELEKMRNKIDSGALFDVLDKAASIAVSFPQAASRMLMELSKSLRRQLYESERKKPFYSTAKKTKNLFGEPNTVVDFLIEKRYRLVRHLSLLLAVASIGSGNFNLDDSFQWVELVVFCDIFLALIYVNIYVLLPRLLFKNRLTGYLLAVIALIIVFVTLLIPSDLRVEKTGIFLLLMISATTKIGFLFAGISAFVLFRHWMRNERHIAQLEAVTLRAELKQLQNQINPHFLFNMLNNILVLIRENPEEAVVILHKLSDMLKYQFNDSTKKEVLLNDDIHFLTDFLNLEKIRRDRFEFGISVENNAESEYVPPLLFIPFVENAVKHSNDAVNLSYIRLNFNVIKGMLHFTCRNSKPLKPRKKNEFSGLGLVNIKRRLELLYDENYSLNIHEDETSYTIQLAVGL